MKQLIDLCAGKDFKIVRLAEHSRVPIPLPLTVSRIWVRPAGWSVDFCNKPIYWHHILKAGDVSDSIRTCDTIFGDPASYRCVLWNCQFLVSEMCILTELFDLRQWICTVSSWASSVSSALSRFCVSVYRQHFPEESLMKRSNTFGGTSSAGVGGSASGSAGSTAPGTASPLPQPGHLITLMPPVRLVNLLPVDMTYYLKGTDIRGSIKPGKTAPLFSVSYNFQERRFFFSGEGEGEGFAVMKAKVEGEHSSDLNQRKILFLTFVTWK